MELEVSPPTDEQQPVCVEISLNCCSDGDVNRERERGRECESSSVALAAQPHSSTVGLQSAVLRASRGFPHGSPSVNPVTLRLVSMYSTVLEILKREEEEGKEKQTELWAASKFPKRPFSICYGGKGGGLIGSVTPRRCETRSEERMALRPGNGTVAEWGNLSVRVSDYKVSNTKRSVFSRPTRARGQRSEHTVFYIWIIQAEVLLQMAPTPGPRPGMNR
ncbi:unnamed protein product [Oreochromis niloticus]|nr:unnamed protein product [Mustela putorius furo]